MDAVFDGRAERLRMVIYAPLITLRSHTCKTRRVGRRVIILHPGSRALTFLIRPNTPPECTAHPRQPNETIGRRH